MTMRELGKALGYKSTLEMYAIHGYTRQNLSRVKKENPKRYKMIMDDIVLKHYGVELNELIELCKLKQVIKN